MGEGAEESRGGGFCGWLIAVCVAAVVVAGAAYAFTAHFHHHHHHDHSEPLPVPGPPGAITQKYSRALSIALQFFDIQKAGKLENNKIKWRGDSALSDGKQANLDLSKGMYDAGDHMKFGLPMAFTATVLSWAILEYGDQMAAVKELDHARDSLKWITDYLVNAHPREDVLYIQVGDPEVDHKCWQRPEEMTGKRPIFQVNKTSPGTDVAAETAAALAAASLVFKEIDAKYSDTLLKHAKQLFTFADTYRGAYSESMPELQKFYNSTGYYDELLWAAAWLYHASAKDKQSYLRYATLTNGKEHADWGRPTWFSWDDKHAGTQILLSRVMLFNSKKIASTENADLGMYRKTAEAVICGLLPDSPTATSSRTKGGLLWVDEWNPLQHSVAASFLAVVYSDYMLTSRVANVRCDSASFSPTDIRNFAISQIDYVLGDNPMKMSYLVGYGSNYPQQVHHRGASIPATEKTGCKGWKWLKSTAPNPNVATGALVGGPFKNDSFIDFRNNSMQVEPSIYNSAVLVGLLSGLVTTSSVPLNLN